MNDWSWRWITINSSLIYENTSCLEWNQKGLLLSLQTYFRNEQMISVNNILYFLYDPIVGKDMFHVFDFFLLNFL